MRAILWMVAGGFLIWGAPRIYAGEALQAPEVVRRLAETYVNALPALELPSHEAALEDYASGFLDGFMHRGEEKATGGDAERRGFEAGLVYREAHPRDVPAILQGFGYKWIIAVGRLVVDFEATDFRPRVKPAERWSVIELDDAKVDYIPQANAPVTGVPVHVAGYLSPEGRHRRAGSAARELYATKITVHEDESGETGAAGGLSQSR